MQIKYDSGFFDQLQNGLWRLREELNENVGMLRYTISELSEDEIMLLLPQTYNILEYLNVAAGRLFSAADRADDILRALPRAAEELETNEKELQREIDGAGRQTLSSAAGVLAAVRAGESAVSFRDRDVDEAAGLSGLLWGDLPFLPYGNLAETAQALEGPDD